MRACSSEPIFRHFFARAVSGDISLGLVLWAAAAVGLYWLAGGIWMASSHDNSIRIPSLLWSLIVIVGGMYVVWMWPEWSRGASWMCFAIGRAFLVGWINSNVVNVGLQLHGFRWWKQERRKTASRAPARAAQSFIRK